jgi:acetylornithine deacetylase/succinyl-diaminopimelate desuccinylase-like protein
MRFEVTGRGQRGHSGAAGAQADLTERMLAARAQISALLESRLTLRSPDGWQSQRRFPFIQVGEPGVYNITPDTARFGVEVRPIPQDDLTSLAEELERCCREQGLELHISVMENGVRCDPHNPYLQALIRAVRGCSGQEPVIGRKLPATSARFAPGGQGVVWGQSGLGPHARDERHFIPSIDPYYRALSAFAEEIRGI